MGKRRVALVCNKHLLGESLEHILGNLEDVELIGAWTCDAQLLPHLSNQPIDLLLIADEEPPSDQTTHLTVQILEAYPDLPVIRVTLGQNVLRIYTSHTLPARSADLVEAIRRLPLHEDGAADVRSTANEK